MSLNLAAAPAVAAVVAVEEALEALGVVEATVGMEEKVGMAVSGEREDLRENRLVLVPWAMAVTVAVAGRVV